jgi:hypothetical protein
MGAAAVEAGAGAPVAGPENVVGAMVAAGGLEAGALEAGAVVVGELQAAMAKLTITRIDIKRQNLFFTTNSFLYFGRCAIRSQLFKDLREVTGQMQDSLKEQVIILLF